MTGWSFGSRVYADAWSTGEMRAIFDDGPLSRLWLEILAALAETQAEFGLIAQEAGREVAAACRGVALDDAFFADFAAGYRTTGHSTAGLIEALRRRSSALAGEWVHVGATVQDVTDTWLMLALEQARALVTRDLERSIAATAKLARRHRDTVMAGRTHGQMGLPITFGFKAAGWLVELRRHLERFGSVAGRMGAGQLCGGVGSLSALGPRGLEVQAAFLARLGLKAPATSWTASRDVLCEWVQILALACGLADRVGQEVYNLQRDEIGELSEGTDPGQIGSITMPHKRNPEIAEHLGALSRVTRAAAAAMLESLPHDHERDGRSWKVEWHAVPEATLASGKALGLLASLLERLEAHPERMRRNLELSGGRIYSESVMLALAVKVGKQTAHRLVHGAAERAGRLDQTFRSTIESDPEIGAQLSQAEIARLFDAALQTGQCAALVDRALGDAS